MSEASEEVYSSLRRNSKAICCVLLTAATRCARHLDGMFKSHARLDRSCAMYSDVQSAVRLPLTQEFLPPFVAEATAWLASARAMVAW